MTTIADLHRRRHEIMEMAAAVEKLLTPEQMAIPSIAKVTHILLCDLCAAMTDHLSDEHKSIYPSLLTHEDQSVKNMAWGLINNDKLLKPEFSSYKRKWLRDCEFQFTDDFIRDTTTILETLRQRMALEERTVVPRIEEAEILAAAEEPA